MGQDTILKSSLFGGYRKRDVTEYIDSILEENKRLMEALRQQVASLSQENSCLRDRSGLFPTEQLTAAAHELSVENERQDLPGGPFVIDHDTQELGLPEGTYVVSKDHGIVSLPEPEPVYHVREKGSLLDITGASHDGLTPSSEKKVPDEAAGISAHKETSAVPDSVRVQGLPIEALLPEKEAAASFQNKIHVEKLSAPQQASVCELQKRLELLENELSAEKKEKQVLAAKLEYSTDLLLQIYRK